MARAAGPGRKIDGGGLSVRAFTRIYAFVQPILTTPTPGTFDSAGQYLHFRYTASLAPLGSRSGGNQIPQTGVPVDFVGDDLVVEFDVQSEFTLPFSGFLELVGGSGDWKWGLRQTDWQIDPSFYQPEIRTLKAFKRAGSLYTIPDNHSYILSTNPAASVIMPGGAILVPGNTLPGTNITPGIQVNVGPSNTWVQTGWRG